MLHIHIRIDRSGGPVTVFAIRVEGVGSMYSGGQSGDAVSSEVAVRY